MPLFKKNHTHDNNNATNDSNFANTQGRGGYAGDQDQFNDTGHAEGYKDGVNRHNNRDDGMGNNTRNPDNNPTYPSSNAPGGGVSGTGDREFDNYETGGGARTSQEQGHGAGVGATGDNDNGYGGTGATGMTGLGASAAQQTMSHQTDMHGVAVHPSSQHMGGQRLEGKLQSAVGTMIGSQTLKAKGQAKEREAVALKAQAAELNEAEHYEQAALARRERAVAHGAHPDFGHLGGPNPGAGASNVNELGGGAGGAAQGGY